MIDRLRETRILESSVDFGVLMRMRLECDEDEDEDDGELEGKLKVLI